MKPKSLAATLFDLHVAIENCERNQTAVRPDPRSLWKAKHRENVKALSQFLPSGSGIDNGTTIEEVSNWPERITLACSFHHMNDQGSYDGWTEHKVYVTPSFNGLNLRITGRDRNAIKEYLHDVYATTLAHEVAWDDQRKLWVMDSPHGDLTSAVP